MISSFLKPNSELENVERHLLIDKGKTPALALYYKKYETLKEKFINEVSEAGALCDSLKQSVAKLIYQCKIIHGDLKDKQDNLKIDTSLSDKESKDLETMLN